jgi:hypothetical protein
MYVMSVISKLPGCQMGPRFKKAMFAEYYSQMFMFENNPSDPRDKNLYGPQLAANVGDRITLGTALQEI